MSRKILIIEDDDAVVAALRVVLESRGFEVHASEDGAEGITLADVIIPDIVILDLYLPGDDGMEICRRIKGGSRSVPPAVIAISSLSEKQIISAVESPGSASIFDAVFPKPVDTDALISKIEKMLSTLNV